MMMKTQLVILAAVLACASAASISWTGFAKDNQWSTAVNWSGDKVPGEGDDVTITEGNVLVTGDVIVNSVAMGTSVNGPANLTFFNSFYVASTMMVDVNGNLMINAGTASVSGTVTMGGALYFQSGQISGQWTVASRAVADLNGAAQKVLSACQFSVEGSLSFSGVVTLNQSSQITVKSTAVAQNDVSIQAGDKTSVLFDASKGELTYNGGGTMQIMAPMSIGKFNFNSGNLTLFESLQFVNTFAIPAGSFVATVGAANVAMAKGVTGKGVLSAAGTTLTLGSVNVSGAVNIIGGTVNFGSKADIGLLTLEGGTVYADAAVEAKQFTMLGGNLEGTSGVSAVSATLQSQGFNLNTAVTVSGNFATLGKSLISFGKTGALTLTSTGTMNVGGALTLTGTPGRSFVNNGKVTVANPLQSQNIDISGTGAFEINSATFTVSTINFQIGSIKLSGSGVFKGSNTYIMGISSVSSANGVNAIFGAYAVTFPNASSVTTMTQPTTDFHFSGSS